MYINLICIRDSLTQQLSQLSLDQSSQLTQLTTRLGRLELLIEQLHTVSLMSIVN